MMYYIRIFTLFCVLKVISGYCYTHGFDTNYCTAPNGVTIPIGAKLDFKEKCEGCSCYTSPGSTTTYMSCCGYGFALAGVMMPPEGCKLIKSENDPCAINFVRINDTTTPC